MTENQDLNILMFGWEFPPHISGGLGTACYGLTKALAQLGNIHTTLMLPKLYGDEDTRYVSLRCPAGHPADCREHGTQSAYSSGMLQASRRFAISASTKLHDLPRPDVVHAHDWLTAPAALVAQRVLDIPLVFHVHSTELDRSEGYPDQAILAIESESLAHADAILAVSDRTRRQLISRYSVDPDRIKVVYNGIDVDENARQARPSVESPLICFLGRVTYQKGPAYFLRAAAIALNANPTLRFVMAGDGDLLPNMQTLAKELGIAERVIFTGFLCAEEVEHLFQHASALVIPSVSEPFGIVALEAVAAGVPVVISKNSGVTEIVSQMIVVEHTDVHSIAKAMLDLASDEVLAQRLRTGSRNEIAAVNWRRAALCVQETYRSVGVTTCVSKGSDPHSSRFSASNNCN